MTTAWLVIALASGILTGCLGQSLIGGCLMIAVAVILRIAVSYIIRNNPASLSLCDTLHYIWTFILFFGLGMLTIDFNRPQFPEYMFHAESDGSLSGEGQFSGKVVSRKTTTKGECYHLNTEYINNVKCHNLEIILFADADQVFDIGDHISGNAIFRPIADATPGKAQLFAFQKGTDFIVNRPAIKPLWAAMRESLALNIEHRDISGESAALVKALICADRRSISKTRLSQFRDAGISHALAVSGMHVGIIATLLLGITMPLTLLKRGRVCRYIVAITGVWIFAIVTGCAYSTLRAATMFTVAAIAWITERRRSVLAAVCSAAIVILLYSPYALWDTGFRLSFICALSLAVFAQRLNPIDHREHPRTYAIFSACLVTLIATGATWALVGYQFGAIPLNFIPSNLIILPLLPAYVTLALIIITIGAFETDIHLLGYILDQFTEIIYKVTEIFNNGSLELNVPAASVALWLIGLAALGISLHIRTNQDNGYMHDLAFQTNKTVSIPWMLFALAILIASIVSIVIP